MKVIIGGKNNIAIDVVKHIILNYSDIELVAIFNRNDVGIDTHQRSFKKYCLDNNIRFVSLEEAYTEKCDVFISLEFDQIIQPSRFGHKKLFNIHFSKLPKYKGVYTSSLPILHNESSSGVTFHFIDEGIDTGDVIYQKVFDIDLNETAKSLYSKYIRYGTKLVIDNIENILYGELVGKKQDAINASYYSKKSINYRNLEIDLNKTAIEIKKQIDAFSFRDYQLVELFSIEILGAEILDNFSKQKPGSIILETEQYIIIATVDYDLKIYKDCLEPLLKASASNNISKLKSLLNPFNVNERNEKGWSPIIVAAYHGSYDAICYLLDNGARINDVNNKGTTVFMYAKDFALKDLNSLYLDKLITLGADVNLQDFSGLDVFDYVSLDGNEAHIQFMETFR